MLAPGKTEPKDVDWNLFHASYAHASRLRLKAAVRALDVTLSGAFKPCEGCSIAIGLRAPISRSTTCRSSERLGRTFCDLSGEKELVDVLEASSLLWFSEMSILDTFGSISLHPRLMLV